MLNYAGISTSDVLSLISLFLAAAAFYSQFLAKYDQVTCCAVSAWDYGDSFECVGVMVSISNSGARPILLKNAYLAMEARIPIKAIRGTYHVIGESIKCPIQLSAGTMESFNVNWPQPEEADEAVKIMHDWQENLDGNNRDPLPLNLHIEFVTMDGEIITTCKTVAQAEAVYGCGISWKILFPLPWQIGHTPFYKRKG